MNPAENKALKKQNKRQERKKKDDLYLGRFARFPNGLADTSLVKYEKYGAVIDGSKEIISKNTKLYIDKIVALCKENGVTPLFVTLPVYYKHFTNYEQKHQHLREVIPTDCPWIDFQEKYDTTAFIPECFENTTEKNQHITYFGSIVSAYKIAHYIHDSLKIELPKRHLTQKWHDMFYGQEGYFYNYPSKKSDQKNVLLCKDVQLGNCYIHDIINIKGDKNDQILLKIKKGAFSNEKRIKASVVIAIQGHKFLYDLELEKAPSIDPIFHDLFITTIKKGVIIESLSKITAVK